MSRPVAARRLLAVCLLLIATASPVLAEGPASVEPAGLVDHLASWVARLWGAAGDLLIPQPAGTENLDGGCILDPSGGCHGGVTPPVREEG